MKPSPRIVALHGFLGRPADLAPLGLPHAFVPDLFRLTPAPMVSWAKRFVRGCSRGDVLFGYSLGGRLALHCLLEAPTQFSAAIIVATHPGLRTSAERAARLRNDREWALKFRSLPWNELMRAWNQTPALKSSKPVLRDEGEYSRVVLAQYLRYASLGEQDFLIPRINALDVPIFWLAPKNEAAVIRGLQLKHPSSSLDLFADGGHRFLFEYPEVVGERMRSFLLGIFG